MTQAIFMAMTWAVIAEQIKTIRERKHTENFLRTSVKFQPENPLMAVIESKTVKNFTGTSIAIENGNLLVGSLISSLRHCLWTVGSENGH